MGYLANYGRNRLLDKQNFLVSFLGGTGTGKTYSALAFCEMVDPNFGPDRICFTTEDFLELVNRRDDDGEQSLKKGSMILYDEAGVGIDARQWFKKENRAMKNVIQTFRHYNIGVAFTMPSWSYMDKSVRLLQHALVIMTDPNRMGRSGSKEWGWAQVFEINADPLTGQIWRNYPKTHIGNIELSVEGDGPGMPNFRFGLASKKLLDGYEFKKKRFTDKLNRESQGEVLGINKRLTLLKVLRYICEHEAQLGIFAASEVSKELIAATITAMTFDFGDDAVYVKRALVERAISMYTVSPADCGELVKNSYRSMNLNFDDFEALLEMHDRRHSWQIVAYDLNMSIANLMKYINRWIKKGLLPIDRARLDKKDSHTASRNRGADLGIAGGGGRYGGSGPPDPDDPGFISMLGG